VKERSFEVDLARRSASTGAMEWIVDKFTGVSMGTSQTKNPKPKTKPKL
jgi:hypothetical protein